MPRAAGGPAGALTPQPSDATFSTEETHLAGEVVSSKVTGPIAVGRRVANRYRVLRLIGAGGMGAVYQVWDDELGVAAALKVILPPRTNDPYVAADLERRFRTELLLSRQVTHKNVVRIHDLGEVEGIKYITMPYIEGANLASILAQGRLTVRQVLHLARQIAAGLAAAHEAGVVHRDLKPANIMVDKDDHALIMDFGIARSASGTGEIAGLVVGTLDYMAPEQAEGRWVDHRADLYAFGLILYEMLTHARRPRASTLAELLERQRQPVPPVRTINPQVPEALEAIAARCLQPQPDARYATTADLVAALDRLDDEGRARPVGASVGRLTWVAIGVIALVTVGATWFFAGRKAEVAPRDPVSVLIADFENRANDPLFNGTLEQALTIGVEGASFITTYPRRDAARLAATLGPGRKLDETGARLVSVREGIKFLVSGSIEATGSGYTLTAVLADPTEDRALRTERERARTKADVLQAVGALAERLRRGMGDETPQSVQRANTETFTTASLAAVSHYTKAQDLQNKGDYEQAIAEYKRAIAEDQYFGRAYAGWANSAFQLGRKAEAEERWKTSLSMMDRMSERERLRTLGGYNLAIARNYEQAIENYSELVKRYPADRAGHSNLALAYFYSLDFSRALEEGRRAVEIYPASAKFRSNSALFGMYASRFDEAAAEARRLLDADPNFADAYFPLAISQLVAGDRRAAIQSYERMAQTGEAAVSRATTGLADVAMSEGRYGAAAALLAAGIEGDAKTDNTEGLASKSVALAEAYAALGRRADALATARKAVGVLDHESVLFPAARVLIAAGDAAGAKALAARLGRGLQSQTRAYARIIDAETALTQGRFDQAVDALHAAGRLYDAWLVHFDLGVAYVRAGQHAAAVSEFDICQKRKGEAVSMFLDDIPSFRYLAPLGYWHARAQEGVGMKAAARQNYEAYVALRLAASKDVLAVDARERLARP